MSENSRSFSGRKVRMIAPSTTPGGLPSPPSTTMARISTENGKV